MCEAGVGRQAMVFIAVWCRKSIALVRMSYRPEVVDILTLGWEGEISVGKVGESYKFQTWGSRETEGRAVTAGQILQRVMILHKLEPIGEQLQSAESMWKANFDKVRARAFVGAGRFLEKQIKHAG